MAEILREAIHNRGFSALALSKVTGVPQPRISAFMRGGDLRLFNANKLADYLGLALQPKQVKRARGRRTRDR